MIFFRHDGLQRCSQCEHPLCFDEECEMITRTKALSIIKEHGWGPTDNTGRYPATGEVALDSNFDHEMGIHESYQLSAVLRWLGY